MQDFSIERLSENIYISRTKKHFKEVISSYFNENYRSAVVMLYSIVICDLLYKMQDLEEIYEDSAAKDILRKIREFQKKNPRSPEWEGKLIKEIHERTKFLNTHDFQNVEQLQKHRHLSAHPILADGISLYSPNKETVKAHIRNMLEGVLVKPPIFSKNIFINLLLDIEENGKKLANARDLERYVQSKYLKNLSTSIINDIFKKLWKIVFTVNDDRAIKNRNLNLSILKFIYKKQKKAIEQYIKLNSDHFSKFSEEDWFFSNIIDFLYENPRIYECFNEPTKLVLKSRINESPNYKLKSWFLFKDVDDYIKEAEKLISQDRHGANNFSIYAFFKILEEQNDIKRITNYALKYYGNSKNFNDSAIYYSWFIEPHLEKFSSDDLKQLISYADTNTQIYWRECKSEIRTIHAQAENKIEANFDYSKFKNYYGLLKD